MSDSNSQQSQGAPTATDGFYQAAPSAFARYVNHGLARVTEEAEESREGNPEFARGLLRARDLIDNSILSGVQTAESQLADLQAEKEKIEHANDSRD